MLRGNRFRLVTLGRLTLVGGAGEEDASLAKRRFKLAVLAVLAMARRPVTRDALLAMFWGEQEEARARHSLSNALSSLRRVLGQRAITTRDAEVALATDAPLDVDVLELANAAEVGDAARVVDLCHGPFLDGVYIDQSPAFEQWVSRERRRVEKLFLQACARQCSTLARARRWTECGALAARWLETEPLSADAALFHLNAIKAPGTRPALAQALEEYERLRARLAREFELSPERAVRELAERIQEQMAATPLPGDVASVVALPPTPPPAGAPASTEAPGSTEVPAQAGDADTVPAPTTSSRRRVPWGIASLVGVALAVGLIAFSMEARRSGQSANNELVVTGRKPVIAIFAMDVRSDDSTVDWLAEGLPQLIAGKLARASELEIVPEPRLRAVLERSGRAQREAIGDSTARDLATRVGATIETRGTIGRDAGKLVLDLTLHDVGSGRLVHSAVLASADALALADEAAARILGATNGGRPGPQLAGLETSSLEAYQHYMRALDLGRAGHFTEYQRELDAALALDSGFITVLRGRMDLAVAANDTALLRRLRATMQRYAGRATEFDRLHQEATDAFYAGEQERSEALARDLVRRYPRDPRAYHVLENTLASHGRFDEAERVATQALALDSLAMEAGTGPCAACSGYQNVVSLRMGRGDFRGAAEWTRRWIRAQPDAPVGWASLAWTYSYMQRPDSGLPLMQRAVSLSGGDYWSRDQLARMLLVARRYDAADSVIAMLEASVTPEHREQVFDLRALLERERGRPRAAMSVIERLLALTPASRGFGDMMLADNQRLLGDHVAAARRYHAPAHPLEVAPLPLPVPSGAARAYCWHHALAADAYSATGDTVALRAIADTLELGCTRSYYGRDQVLYHHVRGLVAMTGHRYAEAEREFSNAVWTRAEGWNRTTVELAKARMALGRPGDAIAALRTGYATQLNAMGHYVPISELDYWMAKAFVQAGERDSARVYAGYVRSAWRDAEPEIRRSLAQLP